MVMTIDGEDIIKDVINNILYEIKKKYININKQKSILYC
ncbi:MAG: hypothetical protein Barrevirus1_11 [Barrevirus sp.]|uniref:Uncharacterized protein n=1 Tax=Barrevirus sp. TaxID=2487763 RepID=A0A3G4ZTN6_9VIRU|nr:MAG: hypothetical protein Barrevirus1_11 [Barrevirus sp.]